MWPDFNQFIKKHDLIRPEDRLLLATSGGVDSMVLAHLFLKLEIHFEVAHCNFQLRGEESDSDESFVRTWCETHRIHGHFKRFELKSAAANKSVQEEARNVRYDWFFELMEERKLNKLVTAHHATDNVETLFINILRGSGMTGWAGIPVKTDQIIRPLLFAEKQEILRYASENEIVYREDQSNSTDNYLRNQIRHLLLPVLTKLKPDAITRLAKNQLHLGSEMELLHELVQLQNAHAIQFENDNVRIDLSKLQPQGKKPEVLFQILRTYGFNNEKVHLILEEGLNGRSFYSASHELITDRGFLIVREKSDDTNEQNIEKVEITEGQKRIEEPLRLRLENMTAAEFKIPQNANIAAFDADQIQFPIYLRKWKTGDRFVPLGMQKQKLVSDFLIDEKVNLFDKESVYVLESAGRIVWLMGYRIADWAKITPETNRILRIEMEP